MVNWRTFRTGPRRHNGTHDRSTRPVKLRHDYLALRQLRLAKAKLAVERTLYARSAEESLLAARWASAWHKLVQRKLDQDLAARLPAPPAFDGFAITPASHHALITLRPW
jgi:hypothetical protein